MIHMALTADEEIRRLRRLAEPPHLGNESRSWPLATGVTGARNGMSQIADFELTTGLRSLIGPRGATWVGRWCGWESDFGK